MSKIQQTPKLDFVSIVFICILTISAIVAPYVIVNTFKKDIADYKKKIEDSRPKPPKTYTASNFTVYGKAVNVGNRISNIDKNNGFRFTVNSENQTTAKINIKYKSERKGGILKVNGNTENLYFSPTNGNWQNKNVIVKLQQGENKIEFCGGWLTVFAPDISEITVVLDNNLKKNYIAGIWKGNYANGKGKTTLTINDDWTGVSEFTWQGTKGSHSVRVNYSNGRYSISGVDWIDKPKDGRMWSFDNWNGTINNGIFSGTDFQLEKTSLTSTTSTVMQNNGVTTTPNVAQPKTTNNPPPAPIPPDDNQKAKDAFDKAINVFANGQYDAAFNFFREAINYNTSQSDYYKKTASTNFANKAKQFIDRGVCDDNTKKWLNYARQLNLTDEVQELINKCN